MVRSIESRFETFSSTWVEKSLEYKTMAISDDMAGQIQKEFETDLYILRIQAGITGEVTEDLEKGIRQLQRYVEISLAKGKANHAREISRERRPARAPLREIVRGRISSRRRTPGPTEEQ